MSDVLRRSRATAHGLCLLLGLAASSGCASSSGPSAETKEPDSRARAHYDLGVDHLKNGRTALAIRDLQIAAKAEPRAPRIHHALAEAYRRRGLLEDARRELLTALEIEPAHHGARLNLSAVYIQMERYPEAIAEARRVVEDPTFAAPWQALVNIGWSQHRLGQIAEARASYELALEYRPGFWRALLNLGILDAEAGDAAAALDRFRQVLALRPGAFAEAEVHYRIAEIHVARGEREAAIQHLGEVVASQRGGEWARRSEKILEGLR